MTCLLPFFPYISISQVCHILTILRSSSYKQSPKTQLLEINCLLPSTFYPSVPPFSQFSNASNSNSRKPHTLNVLNLPKSTSLTVFTENQATQLPNNMNYFFLSASQVIHFLCTILHSLCYSLPGYVSFKHVGGLIPFCTQVRQSFQQGFPFKRDLELYHFVRVLSSLQSETERASLLGAESWPCHSVLNLGTAPVQVVVIVIAFVSELVAVFVFVFFSIIVFGIAFIIVFVTVES